ncbi:MOSC domain-containing protein [Photobacterium phosphoreum]|jgi:MOSC domain-containing protein YiiM|uniref:MOSC domain-containing protein n=1 Tax=Photobacterium phosphoreum TaxID=659 RepID=UPI000D15E4E2|nr:MOSC domain-containing protein [Photobacterium phosphoreum]MCD9464191.1 MOSC domain-containing protein [Photobacterium phosphoreum]MCD9475103.1 MOSC domain-containing protein [Photobacterium phosphoreum]MCD9479110.1 MOSC domain-containing protein [Photobacterium phosphoreum]MCD9483308.1 MOSC domain-containing protein [Photobacterium phosphoreum]MCF2175764.1 MOSC domain-containing protein [Photobacterium phosphoreum]
MKKENYLHNIYRGNVEHCYGFQTAINKSLVEGRLYLSLKGLEGDECADLRHHGGLERALHQYPLEHYAYWQQQYSIDVNWIAPGMGENLSSIGMTEETVCLGDRYQWGEAIIEVSQPRSPCFKLNKRWGIDNFSLNMQQISRCGWLYRVIQAGMVSVDEPLILIAQEPNAMTLREVCDVFFGDPLNKAGLLKLTQQAKLSESWKAKVIARLENNQVERWDFRLLGHESVDSF